MVTRKAPCGKREHASPFTFRLVERLAWRGCNQAIENSRFRRTPEDGILVERNVGKTSGT
jgi:hypothetical protein